MMDWLRENKFESGFILAFVVCLIIAFVLLWNAKAGFDATADQFSQASTELDRLQRLDPFPNEVNLLKMKKQGADFAASIAKLKEELKARVAPLTPLAPNEFQAQLRRAVTAVSEHAQSSHVRLPDNFFLGFDEFANALPDNEIAPLLGRELAQEEALVNILIDAHIDALTAFQRRPLAKEHPSAPPTPSARNRISLTTKQSAENLVERDRVEATFLASPSAARRALNEIAASRQNFYIVHTLHVLNEKEKGPTRGGQDLSTPAPANAANKSPAALNFIVGTEHIQISTEIDLVNFTL